MKILFVITDDYPENGACTSLLNNIFTQGGMIKHADIAVLTLKRQLEQFKTENINGVLIHRATYFENISMEDLKRNVFKKPITSFKGLALKTYYKVSDKINGRKFIKKRLARLIERTLQKIGAEKFDVIVAVAGDFATAEAVTSFANQNNGIKTLIYQVDPCSQNYILPHKQIPRVKKMESEFYRDANAIITTPIIYDKIAEEYAKEISNKTYAMEFPNVAPSSTQRIIEKCSQNIICTFAGSIYSGIRSPDYTIRLFEKMNKDKIQLKIIGRTDTVIKQDENGNIAWEGPKSLQETKALLEETDFLVNIGNIMTNQVPSKLFEYISTGKPIINICKSYQCPTIKYMEKYPLALNLFETDDLDEQVEKMEAFIMENKNKRVPTEEILKIYEKCTPEYCAKQMLEIVTSII